MRGAGGCAGAPAAAAATTATTATATSTGGAAAATSAAVAGAAAAGGASQRWTPRASRHFLPDGGSVQARWTHKLQPVAAAAVVHRAS